jgi:hypothetical protein
MAAVRADRPAWDRLIRLAGAFALAGLTAACAGGMDPGYSVVTQDRFDFMTCPEIIGHRTNWTAREKQLNDLVEKAESSPGGIIVSVTAYRSELAQARTHRRLAEKAARDKGCDAKKP